MSPDAFPTNYKLSPEAQQQLALQTAQSAGELSKPGTLEAVQTQILSLFMNTIRIMHEERGMTSRGTRRRRSRRCGILWIMVDWYGEVV